MVVLLNVGSPSNPSLVQVAMSFVSLSTLECYLAARKDIKGHSLKPRLKFVSQPKMRKWLRQRCQRKLWSGVPSGTQCPTCTGWNILWNSGYTGWPKKVTFRISCDQRRTEMESQEKFWKSLFQVTLYIYCLRIYLNIQSIHILSFRAGVNSIGVLLWSQDRTLAEVRKIR